MRMLLAALLITSGLPALSCIVAPQPDPQLGWTKDTETEQSAWYELPTSAYGHGVLGDAIEGQRLTLMSPRSPIDCGTFIAEAGEGHVFEDTAPRFVDLDNDGILEVIAVRSSFSKGAQLVVYREGSGHALEIMAATPYIGQRFRWLAVVGAADLDGDGTIEIAYVDRPHLAKTLRIVSVQGDDLVEEIAGAGVTNHRIGERDIAGGIRDCGQGPEMIVASSDWTILLALTYTGSDITARQIGRDTSRDAFERAMNCAD